MKIIAVIPARGGSKGLTLKNIQPLNGKPLIAHSIEKVLASKFIDKVIVSTDSEEIAEVAKQHGADVPFIRPNSLAKDNSKTDEVLQHAAIWLEEHGESYDAMFWCHSTLPFRKTTWIDQLIQQLADTPDADSCFMAVAVFKHYWADDNGTMKPLSLTGKHQGHTQRQKMTPIYQEECGLGCVTRIETIKQGHRVGPNMVGFRIKEEYATTDIHNSFDLWVAEQILAKRPDLLEE